jgi:hypothetical protein
LTRRSRSMLRVLVSVWAALAVAGPAPASALNCSSAPSGYGGSWFRSYQDWCRRCGGTPSATANPPTCTPGSNWGGQGSGGAGVAPGPDIVTGFQRMMENYARGTEEEKRRMMGVMDRETRQRILIETERARAAGERKRREEDHRRSNALQGLKGIPDDGGRYFKPLPAAAAPAPPLGGSTPALLRDPSLRGHRIVDCERAATTRTRLAAGLPVQRDAIDRTRAQLASARDDVRESSEQTRKTLVKAARDESLSLSKEILTSGKVLRIRVAALKGSGMPVEGRRRWLEAMDTLAGSAGAMEKLGEAGKSGYAAGVEFRENARTLSEDLRRANKLFVDSGIAEQLGETLSESAGGPLGAFVFRAAKLSIDVGVAVGRGAIGEEEYRRALDSLDTMQTQYNRAEDELKALDADLARYCRTKDTAAPPAPSPAAGRETAGGAGPYPPR